MSSDSSEGTVESSIKVDRDTAGTVSNFSSRPTPRSKSRMSGTTPGPVEVIQIIAQLTDAMMGIQACRFSSAAAAAIYLYGISTSISDEVRLISASLD